MAQKKEDTTSKAGRRLALGIAGLGVLYIVIVLIADEYDWSNQTRLIFDVVALAGFGLALIVALGLWRARNR